MSLFDHIKKRQNAQPETPTNTPASAESAAANEIVTPSVETETGESIITKVQESSGAVAESTSARTESMDMPEESSDMQSEQPIAGDALAEPMASVSVIADDGSPQHFSVGIDLGTTHCVLSYASHVEYDDQFDQKEIGRAS